MSVQVRRPSPFRIATQNLADEVMSLKCKERDFAGLPGSIGIWLAVDLTIRKAEQEKKAGRWRFNVPDIETVRRLIAYLADPEEIDDKVSRPEDSPPKWKHLTFQISDIDPRTAHVRYQSGYTLSEIVA